MERADNPRRFTLSRGKPDLQDTEPAGATCSAGWFYVTGLPRRFRTVHEHQGRTSLSMHSQLILMLPRELLHFKHRLDQ